MAALMRFQSFGYRALFSGLIGISVFYLSGCATLDAKVAIPVPCLKADPPAMPQTTDESALLAMSEYAGTLTVWAERLELKAYSAKASAIIEACK